MKKPKNGGQRKRDKDKEQESEARRLKVEYGVIGGVIMGLAALMGYYFWYISGSKIGRADTHYKTAVDTTLRCEEVFPFENPLTLSVCTEFLIPQKLCFDHIFKTLFISERK